MNLNECKDVVDFARLWYHECMRVFHDRLVNEIDRGVFKDLLKNKFIGFSCDEEEILGDSERIIFGDFMGGIDTVGQRNYNQIADLKKLLVTMDDF